MTYASAHYTLTEDDVGRLTIQAFGRIWRVADFIGRVLPQDAGKRVYWSTHCLGLQVENREQYTRRLVAEAGAMADDLAEALTESDPHRLTVDDILADAALRTELLNLFRQAHGVIKTSDRFDRMIWTARGFGAKHGISAIQTFNALAALLAEDE